MIARKLQHTIENSLQNFPVVGILGSRQVGKTTLAKEILKLYPSKAIYLDLELTSDLNKLHDPEIYLSHYSDHLVIIDEIQQMPELFSLIRALVDQNRVNGRFLILGSASPDLIKQASESLAGRIIYHELSPFSFDEINGSQISFYDLWLKGGYPESFLAKNTELSLQWRESFIRSFLERDIPQLGIRVPAIQLRRFWTMMAHSHGQLWNASQIANSLGISAPTVKHYLDILSDTFIVRQLRPFHLNIKKRLVKSPKVYLRDSGLLHSLLRLRNFDELQSHPALGNSWEGFVIEQMISLLPYTWEVYFYRTSAGAEIDLLVFGEDTKPIAIEIKYSLSPKVSKGFWIAFDDLDCDKGFVVYPGDESYPLGQNVYTLPLKELTNII